VIQATFIEKKLAGTVTPEVRGFVKNHNDRAKTFQIGNLTVNYTTALINDMPSFVGNAWNGLFVEAKGTSFTPGPNVQTEGTLVATKVEPENQGVGNDIDEFEVEGFVTEVVSPGDFFISSSVGMTRVQTTASTEFRGGTIDEIVVGAKLSAEGRFANDILTAKHVKFQDSVKLEGNIAAIDLVANTFTITGLPGVTVSVNSQTEIDANSGNALNDLSVGDHVRVRGRVSGASSVIATRIELRSASDDVDLQGPVQSFSNPFLEILGVQIDTNTSEFDDPADFHGLNDQAIGRDAFFGAVQVGTVVKVKGRLTTGDITWREVELED
jgi:cytoskeletal protein CcmA (bactofilin family)